MMLLTTRLQLFAWLVILVIIQLVALSSSDPLARESRATSYDDDDNSNSNSAAGDNSNSMMTSDENDNSGDGDVDVDDGFFADPFVRKSYDPSRPQYVLKRASANRLVKKIKPIIVKGYSMDINIETFKSKRYCVYNEVCKIRYKQHFECVCPKQTLCVGQGSLFDAQCSSNLAPYVWIQHLHSLDESSAKKRKFPVV